MHEKLKLESKTIRLRLVEEADAEFILKLRLDSRYNQHLSAIVDDIDAQKRWIRSYKVEERAGSQFYFIIEREDKTPCGTVRVYDLRADSFCWGSWILNENKSHYAALESAFLVYDFGFKHLGYKACHFDVRRDNESVVAFHRRLGAIETGQDEQNLYFHIDQETVALARTALESKLT